MSDNFITTAATSVNGLYLPSVSPISPRYSYWKQAHNIALLGDSIVSLHDHAFLETNRYYSLKSPYNWANIYMRQRINWVKNTTVSPALYNFGVGGNTAAQIRARVPDVVATAADTVMIMAGANNMLPASYTREGTVADVIGAWDDIRAGGKQVIALAIMPLYDSATKHVLLTETNARLEEEAFKRGIPFIKWPIELTNGVYANPDYFTVAINDIGVHVGNAGGALIGKYLARQLDPWVQKTPYAIPASNSSAWKTPNPYMTGSGAFPTSWATWGTGGAGAGTATTSYMDWAAAGDATMRWWKINMTAGALTGFFNSIVQNSAANHQLVAGDIVQPICRFRTLKQGQNIQRIVMFLSFVNDANCKSFGVFESSASELTPYPETLIDTQMEGVIMGPPVAVTAGAASGAISCSMTVYGYGTWYLAQQGVIKV